MKMIREIGVRQSVPVEVVTFLSQEAADRAADWFAKFSVDVAETVYAPFSMFCESLKWRRDVGRVIDTNRERLIQYGQLGWPVLPGREW
jgi:hypothetical protein